MAEEEVKAADNENEESEQLGGGAYEVIRNRLQQQNQQLLTRVEKLNQERKRVFGGQESKIIGNERIQTENNCVARDIFSLGNRLIFGYNVQKGLRTEIKLEDVFSIHEFVDGGFKTLDYSILGDEDFLRHFKELYKYYSNARFLQFVRTPTRFMMLFQIGETVDNIKVFRWALDKDENIQYIDDRGDTDYQIPPQHAFSWTETTRDDQVAGRHPHVSIKNRVYVETIGGDLTIKIDDNTESGEGIYSEAVDNPDQTLDDAEIWYAEIGNLIILKILPYQEKNYRYLVYNEKTEGVTRIDSIDAACIELPEDHGIIFPRGYYLQDGTTRQFQEDVTGMRYLECLRSPNGEDFLYIFYHPAKGRYVLLQYNLITKEIANPIFCHGYATFDDGQMVMFSNPDDEPKRIHPMQIWQTAFYADTHQVTQDTESYLNKIGNRELVRGVSDCFTISRIINSETVNIHTYHDLVTTCDNTLASYHWLGEEACFQLKESILEIKATGIAAVDEYEKVVGVRQETARQIEENVEAATKAIKDAQYGSKRNVNDFVDYINTLRSRRGQVISLRELKYADLGRIDQIEEDLAKATEQVSMQCVEFLLRDDALDPYFASIKEVDDSINNVEKVADIVPVEEEIEDIGGRLDLLTDVVNNLQIDDSTKTTEIVDSITEVYGQVNRVKAVARNLRKELGRGEASAEFAAQFRLVSQSITNFIGLCDSPAKCDEFMTKIMVSIEELEGKFADYDEFIEQLTEKREEAYTAFTGRKQVLEEEEKRRVGSLISSAERILKGIRNRAETLKTLEDVNSYFASDLMVGKLRDITDRLQKAGNSVKADDLVGQLKSLRDETVRKLRDKLELFADGDNVITLGGYKFNVNTQPLNLTTVLREGEMYFHLTGTDYYELIDNKEFLATKDLWDQDLVSENSQVYRAEYLAYKVLMAGVRGDKGLTLRKLTEACDDEDEEKLLDIVRDFASNLYTEGYDKGIHDIDASRILRAIVKLYNTSELLRYDSSSRAFAIIFWAYYQDEQHKHFIRNKVRSFGTIGQVFDVEEVNRIYIDELHAAMRDFYAQLVPDANPAAISNAAEFLFYELQDQEELIFTINKLANDLHQRFVNKLKEKKVYKRFCHDVEELEGDLKGRLDLVRDWVTTYCRMNEDDDNQHFVWELIALIVTGDDVQKEIAQFSTYVQVKDLLGQHRTIEEKNLDIYFDRFLLKMTDFVQDKVPRFERYTRLRTELTVQRREEMKLGEFEPRVMGSFVRNRLINNVYLNMVGANFAKQMGVAGESKRTDLMGLLMLISPPGYGKTTLMEYISNRLGLTFMKINGPAIGHQVTSLDPSEAPNATAREELYKLNMSLEMGNNVMIYLDDIQHCNPELLQKFISLCDAQRKIEGVHRGKTRTYDLRGKKVAVVMAGNPYTESGEKFKIPDMLANRADTYNLGDVSSTAEADFALSFVENAMTSNPVLSQIASRSHADLYRFWQMLETGAQDGVDFDYNWSAAETSEILNTLGKLKKVQEVVLKVNEQYIYSAAQQDEYRTEPPFKLQGSYRNMCRMAEKIQPIMTDDEVMQVIIDHYYNEAQTLTTGAESNILKFREIAAIMTDEEIERWNAIKKEFNRRQTFAGVDDGDQIGRVLAQMSSFTTKVGDIGEILNSSLNGSVREALQAINFEPLVQAIEKSAGNGDKEAIDLAPLITALQGLKPEKESEPLTIDVQPIASAIETVGMKNAEQEGEETKFRDEFSKVCERQITAIECMLPIVEGVKLQNDTFVRLRELLEQILEGVIEVKAGKSKK